MLCDICKQPLEPWEVTTCELCGEILQNSPTSALTQTEKQSTLHSPAARCSRTDNQQGAMTMSNHTTEDIRNAVFCCRQLIQQEELQAWCTEHVGESMADIVSQCPPCEDWYPEVDIDGDLTGEIVHARDEDYQMFRNDDRTQCVVRR